MAMDFGGHYNRFDVFRVSIDAGGSLIDLTPTGPDFRRVGGPLVTNAEVESVDPARES